MTPRFCYDKRDVGCKLKIHNSRYDEWVAGDITAFDSMRKMHLVRARCLCLRASRVSARRSRAQVVYEDGSRKWHSMREKKFEVISFSMTQCIGSGAVGGAGAAAAAAAGAGVGAAAAAAGAQSQSRGGVPARGLKRGGSKSSSRLISAASMSSLGQPVCSGACRSAVVRCVC